MSSHPTTLPTLEELCKQHAIDPSTLMEKTEVPHAVIDQILCNEPIATLYAIRVLRALSELTQYECTLKNVYISRVVSMQEIVSEIAWTKRIIEEQYEAGKRGMYAFSEKAKHMYVTDRVVDIADCISALDTVGGPELVARVFEQMGMQPDGSEGMHA